MDFINPLPALVLFSLAALTSLVLVRVCRWNGEAGRFATIDGLRGWLALGVFAHHSRLWYTFIHEGVWAPPPSRLYTMLGQCAVALFFMVTAFLFLGKLLDARGTPFNWKRLYVSRLYRLYPAYLLMLILTLGIVAVLSKGELSGPIPRLLIMIGFWIPFSLPGLPDINDVPFTFSISAGVSWTLIYEWAFYLSLPVLARCVGVRTGVRAPLLAVLAVVCVLTLTFQEINPHCLVSFLGGGVAAFGVRSAAARRLVSSRLAAVLAIACLVGTIAGFDTVYAPAPLIALTIAFFVVALGNDLFGALSAPASRLLGEISYSVYLLHGIFLTLTFRLLIGMEGARSLSPIEYWGTAVALTPLIVGASFLCFRLIEKPAIERGRIRGRARPQPNTTPSIGEPPEIPSR